MEKIDFENLPSQTTALSAEIMDEMQDNIEKSVVYQGITQPLTGEKVWLKYGKNLYNPKLAYAIGTYFQNIAFRYDITLGENYTFTALNHTFVAIKTYNNNDELVRTLGSTESTQTVSFTVQSGEVYMILDFYSGNNFVNIDGYDFTGVQLEKGLTATTYEPYMNKEILIKDNENKFKEFYNENKILKENAIYINDDVTYSQELGINCITIGNYVLLDIKIIAFKREPSNYEILLYGLPPAKNYTIFGLFGLISATGDSCRLAITQDGKLQTHWGNPHQYGDAANKQYSGFVIYEKA